MRNYPFDAVRSEEGAKKSNNELSESGRIKEDERARRAMDLGEV